MNTAGRFHRLLQSLNGDGRHGAWLLVALALLLLPLAAGDAGRSLLQYQRSSIAAGQWWRLATAHIVHVDLRHALLNAAALALLWALFARAWRPAQWLAALAILVASTSAGLWWLQPRLQWYVGASGVLHGIFACGCIALLHRRRATGMAALAALAVKLAWEQWQGALPLAGDIPVVTAAHAFGAAGGVLAGLVLSRRLYFAPRKPRGHA